MRSDLVHRAHDKVQNRFQLCRLTSSSARRMTRSSMGMRLAINEALEAISGHFTPIVAQPAPCGRPITPLMPIKTKDRGITH